MDDGHAVLATTAETPLIWPGDDASRVPLWVYSDKANYQRELDRIFYGPHWHYIGVDVEVPEIGDYKRTTIGERSVLMVRDSDNSINALQKEALRGWKKKKSPPEMSLENPRWSR